MRKVLLSICFALIGFVAFAAEISRVEPAFWWVGLKNQELQVMVYGEDIASSKVTLKDYPGVVLKEVVKVENPNYLFIYLDVTDSAKPGTMQFEFKEGRKTLTQDFELKARSTKPGAMGFTPADVMYLITPDRFANGDPTNDNADNRPANRARSGSRHGGDVRGVINNLNYIKDLGFTTIWLNPLQENLGGEYHGYAITDYYDIDAHFGTMDEYIELVDKAHDQGMKIVMDMIFNHCGRAHWWMEDLPTSDWLNFQEDPQMTNHHLWALVDVHSTDNERNLAADGWFNRGMPDLNQRNPHLAKYLIQNTIWWIEHTRIDGIRQDTHPYADFDFMARWCKEILEEYPDFNIVGEAWYVDSAPPAWWQADSKINPKNSHLKTVMDFQFTYTAQQVFDPEYDADKEYLHPQHFRGLGKIYEAIAQDFLYKDLDNILIFLDNHDIGRFAVEGESNLDRYKVAYALLLTMRGIPQIYYGSELLMAGRKQDGDPGLRKDFPGGWEGDPVNAFTAEGRTPLQNEAWDYMQTILQWRKTSRPIAEGKLYHYNPDNSQCYVYARITDDGETVLVILNGSVREQKLNMDRYYEVIGDSKNGRDIISGKTIALDAPVTIAPRTAYIMELD